MKRKLQPFDVVALTEDDPEHQLVRGQVGTIVETLAPGVFEVDFSDNGGRTYALISVKKQQLMLLLHQPISAA